MAKTINEVEFKWEAYDRNDFATFLHAAQKKFALTGPHEHRLEDYYFDSDDWFFSRTKTSCRIRRDGPHFTLTLKESSNIIDGMAVRKEKNTRLPAAAFDAAQKEAEKILNKKLVYRFSLTNDRLVYNITGKFDAELCLDSFTINLAQGKFALKEIELEFNGGSRPDYQKATQYLTSASRLKSARVSKVKMALAALAHYEGVK